MQLEVSMMLPNKVPLETDYTNMLTMRVAISEAIMRMSM